METSGTTGEETTSYWFDLPIDVAEFEEKLGVGAESGDYRIIEKVLPFADEVHEHTSVYQLNELDFMYRQLSSDMQEEYVSLLTVFENLEALYICRNVITVYHDCKSMIDVTFTQITWFVITEFIIILFGDIPPLSMIEGAFLKYFGIPVALTWFMSQKTFDGKKPYSFLKSQITYALRPKITYAGKAVKLQKETFNETITAVRSVNYVPDKIY